MNISITTPTTPTGLCEVKASIKLRIIPNGAPPTVVVRSFQVSRKPKKMEFKALGKYHYHYHHCNNTHTHSHIYTHKYTR